jgi:fucose permease
VKAIASFLAPILAAWGATTCVTTFGLNWRILFLIYAVVSFLSISALWATPIEEEKQEKANGIGACLKLLGKPFILLCFLGIMCHVGIDVGTNTTAPKIIMERVGLPLEEAGYATGIYFIFRTLGCFLGAFILRYVSAKRFFALSVLMMLASMIILLVGDTLSLLYVGIALVGFGNSNVFSVIFAQALTSSPDAKNEVSGLMIMGLFGGTIFPLAMGYAADAVGQIGAVSVMLIGVIYLMYYTLKIKK